MVRGNQFSCGTIMALTETNSVPSGDTVHYFLPEIARLLSMLC